MTTEKKLEPIDVLLVSDANYAAFLATTIISILKNAAPEDELRFHIVDGGLKASDKEKIEELKKTRPFELRFYTPDLSQYLPRLLGATGTAFPLLVNSRLFAARFLPNSINKIIYMDVDVVVLKSLRDFWNLPVEGKFCAAVPDRYMRESHPQEIGLANDGRYFNSGVLLINLKKWRDEDAVERFFEIFAEKKETLCFPDQDALNILADHWSYVVAPGSWNCHPRDYVEGEVAIIHYMGRRHCSPHLDILFEYAAETPYRRLPMQTNYYKITRRLKRLLASFLSIFLFRRKWRRSLRRTLGVH